MKHDPRMGVAITAWQWIEQNVRPHLAAGGGLHSKGSNGLPAEFRRRFLSRLESGEVRFATPSALALPVGERKVEHVVPMKRIAI